jgi:hypothetical protein
MLDNIIKQFDEIFVQSSGSAKRSNARKKKFNKTFRIE